MVGETKTNGRVASQNVKTLSYHRVRSRKLSPSGFCDVPYTWLKLCAFDECSQDSFRFEHHGIEQGLRCRGGALLLEREFLVFTRIPWTGRNVRRLHFKAPTMCLRSKTSGSRFCRTQAKMTCTKCSVEQYDATLKILDWFSFWI